MKKIYPFLLLLPILLLFSYTGGGPYGHTGSPGDNNQTCAVCHTFNGTAPTPTITLSGFPADGNIYEGTTYNLTLDISGVNNTKYGFQITAEDAAHQKIGTFSSLDNSTQSLNYGKSLGHKSQGTSQHSWNFTWEVPVPTKISTQDITFYYACNLSNNNGSDSGDYIATGSLTIHLNMSSVGELSNDLFKIYPNPVEDVLYFNNNLGKISKFEVVDMNGKTYPVKADKHHIDMSFLASGNYFLRIKTTDKQGIKQFIKK